MAGRKRRGFAAMDPEHHRAISKLGGQALHDSGQAHTFTREEARHAGKLGGWVVSRDRQRMARLGRKGGTMAQRNNRRKTKGRS